MKLKAAANINLIYVLHVELTPSPMIFPGFKLHRMPPRSTASNQT